MSLKAECGLRDAFDGGVHVGFGVHDDGVLAAHFQNGALNPNLALLGSGGAMMNAEADVARSGEGDEARFRMLDDGVAKTCARARTEIHDARRHAGFFQNFHKFRGDGWRVARRLQNYGIAADGGGGRHAGHNCARKIPRRNYGADSERNILQRVAFAGELHGRLGGGKAQRFAAIKFQEVDGFADVGVGFAEIFRDFKDQPCAKFKAALRNNFGGAEEYGGALFPWSDTPGGEGFQRGLHGGFDVLGFGFLVDADNFGRLRGIYGADFFRGGDFLAADNQRIFAAELLAHHARWLRAFSRRFLAC